MGLTAFISNLWLSVQQWLSDLM